MNVVVGSTLFLKCFLEFKAHNTLSLIVFGYLFLDIQLSYYYTFVKTLAFA